MIAVQLDREQWRLVQIALVEGAQDRARKGREEGAEMILNGIVPAIAAAAESGLLDAVTEDVRESLGLASPSAPPVT